MKPILLLTVFATLVAFTSVGLADPADVAVDGSAAILQTIDLPAKTMQGDDGRTIDIVGGATNTSSADGRAKGNAFRVDVSVTLDEVEFWLNFSSTQTLTYYVFTCPIEFGTYTEVYRASGQVTGVGPAWYSTGTIAVPMNAGSYYIIAVSWNGNMTYYFDTGDSQATSFGSYVHGYAVGYDPLPSSFESSVNDQAIYYQRLMTTIMTPVEESTWGRLKALYR